MNNLIINNLYKFPHDVDLIVGIPRSGMMPANFLALYLNKPYTDIDSFIEGRILSSGSRGSHLNPTEISKVLIVDDSISHGKEIAKARQKLVRFSDKYHFVYAAIFATTYGKKFVDVLCEIVDTPRMFQWNFFHHYIISKACLDIDGVLCQNPPIDDDGEKYIDYITNAIPYFLPTVPVDTLVTCRLEKYRPQTEEWLKKNGVVYRKLIMLNMTSKEERTKWGLHGVYKGEIYKNSDNVLFVESSLAEAQEICRISGKQVFCTETFEMYDNYSNITRANKKMKNRIKGHLKSMLISLHLYRV